jgi:murein DD-endopeptidase MepM/ murein hydrolase activator NlpD
MKLQTFNLAVFFVLMATGCGAVEGAMQVESFSFKGYGTKKTGLVPRYHRACSRITSFYGSWEDLDGSERDEPHSGIDAGQLGDAVLAPAPGTVVAAWRANWGWGWDGALLILHSKSELGLSEGPKYYYSEFDHLRFSEIKKFSTGDTIKRGQRIGTVSRPGGNPAYLPEVHWEVWEVDEPLPSSWHTNKYKGRDWFNGTAQLIDPLYMLSRNTPPAEDGGVDIVPFDSKYDYSSYRGFTYILPCN